MQKCEQHIYVLYASVYICTSVSIYAPECKVRVCAQAVSLMHLSVKLCVYVHKCALYALECERVHVH